MKNYIGISLDTSGSMRGIALDAGRDYNAQIEAIKEGSTEFNIDTIVSVVHCGVGHRATVERVVTNSAVNAVKPLLDGAYVADGGATPLFQSIEELITMMESVPDAAEPERAAAASEPPPGTSPSSSREPPGSRQFQRWRRRS